jgi:hypothetical protein
LQKTQPGSPVGAVETYDIRHGAQRRSTLRC